MDTVSTSKNHISDLFGRINYERHSRPVPGDFKLANMSTLLKRLGNPHLKYPVIHVAGTKGKGSVSAFIGSILECCGYRTGIYSSPHLERINQRIVIDSLEISDDQLELVLRKLQPTIEQLDNEAKTAGSRKLTFFEVITATAFQHFSDTTVDAAVIEVGLGGRLDSTNLCQPEICVITNISLDHTKQLGSTVEEIAAEKAGIIKPGVPVVSGVVEDGPRQVIADIAAERNAPLIELARDFDFSTNLESLGNFDFCEILPAGKRNYLTNVACRMLGTHQHQNASIAIAVCRWLLSQGWCINKELIREGLAKAFLPGRCEIANRQPLVILDIAHNEASTISLAEVLKSEPLGFDQSTNKSLIFAVSKEKDAAAMLAPLLPLFDQIYVTKFQNNPRGRSAAEIGKIADSLAAECESDVDISIADSPELAWQTAMKQNSDDAAICVTGSAFLIAELRPLLLKKSN